MISVIIPAHNEEAVIGRCLSALLHGAAPGELEVIVACNGCSDRTAERARAFGPPVWVIELEEASKVAALNAGDRAATGYPRFYVDADVVLPLSSVRAVAGALQRTGHLLASPVPVTHTSQSSRAVRAFYAVWLRLPYNQVMVGTGVYALSERGRKRFAEFPTVIADDGFVRSRFRPEERIAVAEATVNVIAPKTLGDLIRVKTRTRVGGYQLAARYPQPAGADPKRPAAIARSLPWGLTLPWQLAVYLWVNVVTRARARRRLHTDKLTWDRDETSRARNHDDPHRT